MKKKLYAIEYGDCYEQDSPKLVESARGDYGEWSDAKEALLEVLHYEAESARCRADELEAEAARVEQCGSWTNYRKKAKSASTAG